MNFKGFFAGVFFLYALLLLLSYFGLEVFFFIPISVASLDVGKPVTAIILFVLAYFLIKK